jgi:hyperosmotically inducible protein
MLRTHAALQAWALHNSFDTSGRGASPRSTDGVREGTDTLQVDSTVATDRPPAAAASSSGNTRVQRPDAWVTMKIQAKYFLDADVKGHQIDVDTRNGVVTLKGTVATATQKQEAEQIAKETDGVTRVVNRSPSGPLRVRKPLSRSAGCRSRGPRTTAGSGYNGWRSNKVAVQPFGIQGGGTC